jgi:hypothetical protein
MKRNSIALALVVTFLIFGLASTGTFAQRGGWGKGPGLVGMLNKMLERAEVSQLTPDQETAITGFIEDARPERPETPPERPELATLAHYENLIDTMTDRAISRAEAKAALQKDILGVLSDEQLAAVGPRILRILAGPTGPGRMGGHGGRGGRGGRPGSGPQGFGPSN